MGNYIILRKHMLIDGYMVINEKATKQDLIEFIQKIPSDHMIQYKFIIGNFVQPTIAYKEEQLDETPIVNKEVKGETFAQRIFKKWGTGGIFHEQNIESAI